MPLPALPVLDAGLHSSEAGALGRCGRLWRRCHRQREQQSTWLPIVAVGVCEAPARRRVCNAAVQRLSTSFAGAVPHGWKRRPSATRMAVFVRVCASRKLTCCMLVPCYNAVHSCFACVLLAGLVSLLGFDPVPSDCPYGHRDAANISANMNAAFCSRGESQGVIQRVLTALGASKLAICCDCSKRLGCCELRSSRSPASHLCTRCSSFYSLGASTARRHDALHALST